MLGKIPNKHQVTIFQTPLVNFINMDHELVHLAQHIDWDEVENEFKGYFSENGRPSVPVRRMVGLMLLKSLYNLSDESTVARWVESPYFQYFTGEYVFQIKPPIDPADFSKFRRRTGEEGAEKLLKLSIKVNADEIANDTEVMVDTTVQEKNITFPTDVKLCRKVIARCHILAKEENIVLRRSYTRELKDLNLKVRFMNHPKRKKEGLKAKRRMQTIAKALVNDLERKMNSEQRKRHIDDLLLYSKVVTQTRTDKNKVYSLHEPEVQCIAKGKEAKPYEFGNKSSIAKSKSGIIVGAMAFKGNPFDGHTLPEQLEQIKRLSGMTIENALVDRGYRGRKWIGDTKVEIPGKGKPTDSYYKKTKAKNKFRRRAGIEPVIGHLKQDHRMQRNYLKGNVGDSINTMMAAAGFNLKHWLNKVILVFNLIYRILIAEVLNLFTENRNRLALLPVGVNCEKRGFWQD
ncbi:MAG: IS5 family transposase [Bacteroidia bacterium]|nr:IS5 family transposase [Bacteroidia bacterium]